MTQAERSGRRRGNWRRLLLLALAAMLLILLLLIIIFFWPPGRQLTADAGGPYTVGEGQPLTLDGSGSSGGTITDYAWDFGDGTTGSGITATHTYDDGPAQFNVSLVVTDNQGQTANDTTQVTVNNLPPVVNAGGPYTCMVGETIPLTGACDDPSPVDAASLTCTWADFSGAAISQPSYTCPTSPGQMTVTLTATDKDGASGQASATVSVITPTQLTADANGPYIGEVGAPVSFDGSGSTPPDVIQSYSWEFGDGQTGMGVVISHTYTATGTYTVTLTVADTNLQATDTTTATITAPNQAPTAVIETYLISKDGRSYRFDGSKSTDPDGQIDSYDWNFGDGNVGTGAVVDHHYMATGHYSATLTVTDDRGATGSASKEIQVP
ncbi:MAG: PKD domain-containing protein [Anaerolineae bacterium]|jgi:PKD repeat protein